MIDLAELKLRAADAHICLKSCDLCPRRCKADRLGGQVGFCRSGALPIVSSYNLHHGEEPPISGERGSGTIFFTNCNMRCIYCQNYPISQLGHGRGVSEAELAAMMISLQKRGAHNINLVTPSHFVAQIIGALAIASDRGLSIPIVYNTSSYDSLEALRLLDGVIDVYLADFRYWDAAAAQRYSSATDYPQVARTAIAEMHRQVGDLALDEEGVARRGLIVRHLVLPGHIAGTGQVMRYLMENISPGLHISLMDQYFPAHKAKKFQEINRKITPEEYNEALFEAEAAGVENGWLQSHN